MNRKTRLIAASAAAAVVIGAGTGVGIAAAIGGDDDEAPISGEALDRASAAALEHTGEGRVTETEAGDEESYYEVEVTLGDGSQVDVQLDRDFNVVDSSADREDDDDTGNDDD